MASFTHWPLYLLERLYPQACCRGCLVRGCASQGAPGGWAPPRFAPAPLQSNGDSAGNDPDRRSGALQAYGGWEGIIIIVLRYAY